MGRITLELLKKRAEHNDGNVTSLEEIALHQQELEKIENLDLYCRHLKILLLQDNIIEKMENLNKMKELEYINLAVNSISVIEGLHDCESLRKLDMTCNYIDVEDLEQSMINLSKCPEIKELYTTGNPCESWPKYKEYVYATVPQLMKLNGIEITHSMKILAKQELSEITKLLRKDAEESKKKKASGENKITFDKAERRKMYLELEEQKKESEEHKKKARYGEDAPVKPPPSVYNDSGEIRLCNEGKYKFNIDDDSEIGYSIFTMYLPKYLDTSLITVDLNPKYIRVNVKGKITQIKFFEDILVEKSKIQRSQITGALVVKCPMAKYTDEDRKIAMEKRKKKEEEEILMRLKESKEKERIEKETKQQALKKESQEEHKETKAKSEDINYDLSDLPPLE